MPLSLEYLLNRYVNKTCTSEEKEMLMELLRQSGHDAALQQQIGRMIEEKEGTRDLSEETAASILQAIFQAEARQVVPVKKPSGIRWWRVAAAAAVIGIGYFLFLPGSKKELPRTENAVQRFKNDVPPGGNKAILILSNGSSIVLDSAGNGILAQQGNSKVVKLNNGQLAYHLSNGPAAGAAETAYNTLSTPRGGQYKLMLPDGTLVWLDAASSIRYPVTFAGDERKVEISGQAYFEVASSLSSATGKKIPFTVSVNGMDVRVLGTHFNINAYDDEATLKTTLLEGAVKVTRGDAVQLLAPGQQAQLYKNGELQLVKNADLEEVMAWKDGLFRFHDVDINSIMRQVARWYNVDVDYKGPIPAYPFKADIQRDVPVSELLKLLELTNLIHFQVDGRKITVMR
jgi:ferric-dicitrate binding protein FerR (iron transport regulator)